MLTVQWIDIAIISIIFVSTLVSIARGFVREAMSLVIWSAAAWASFRFSGAVDAWLTDKIANPMIRLAVGCAAVFLVVLLFGTMVSRIICLIVQKTGLSSTDRVFGMLFGAARGVLIVTVLLVFARLVPLTKGVSWQQAWLVKQFKPLETQVGALVTKHLARYLPKNANSV